MIVMKAKTKDTSKQVELNKDFFSTEYNQGLVHQVIVTLMNNIRSGNSAQKTRAEVRGGGKKPWKQKGTGRARAGSIRSPLWRSGGVVFASKKRNYEQKINRKMYKKAVASIFAELMRQDRLHIVEEFKVDTHKTKEFIASMQQLALNNALLILKDLTENCYLASRNLINYAVTDTTSLDPVSLLKYEHVIVTEQALMEIVENLQ